MLWGNSQNTNPQLPGSPAVSHSSQSYQERCALSPSPSPDVRTSPDLENLPDLKYSLSPTLLIPVSLKVLAIGSYTLRETQLLCSMK